jgi:hypothetical protein
VRKAACEVWAGGMDLRVGFININDMYNNDVGRMDLRVGFININDMYNNDVGGMDLRVGFININDMYNNDVGKGGVYAYEAYEVK